MIDFTVGYVIGSVGMALILGIGAVIYDKRGR
jgi:hypothetical protein